MRWINIQKSTFEECKRILFSCILQKWHWCSMVHVDKFIWDGKIISAAWRVFPWQEPETRAFCATVSVSIEGSRDVVTFIGSPISGTTACPPPYSSHLYSCCHNSGGPPRESRDPLWLNLKKKKKLSTDAAPFSNLAADLFFTVFQTLFIGSFSSAPPPEPFIAGPSSKWRRKTKSC